MNIVSSVFFHRGACAVKASAVCAAMKASAVVAFGGVFLASANAIEVWEYVDEQGNAHYSSKQENSKYRLYYSDTQTVAADVNRIATAAMHKDSAPQADTTDGLIVADSTSTSKSRLTPRMQPRVKATYKGILYVEKAKKYKELRESMRAAAKKHKVDYELIQAVVAAESGFDAQAVSHRGAVGLMQILPSTAKGLGVKATAQKTIERRLLEPHTNVMAGAKYLRYLTKKFKGRVELAVAAYNAGQGTVRRSGNAIPRYRETQKYVTKVLTLYSALKPSANIKDVPTLVAQSTKGYKVKSAVRQPSLVVRNSDVKSQKVALGKPVPVVGYVQLGDKKPSFRLTNTLPN